MATEELTQNYLNYTVKRKIDIQYSELYKKYEQKIKDGNFDKGNVKNAFEHAFGSAFITYDRSKEDAYFLGLTKEHLTKDKEIKAHEFYEDGTRKRSHDEALEIVINDTNRDLWNNNIGIQEAL